MPESLAGAEKVAASFMNLILLLQQKMIRPSSVLCRNELSPLQFQAIVVLAIEGPLNSVELAQRVMISKQQASSLVKRLTTMQMTEQVRYTTDRRRVHIVLTEKARNVMEQKRAALNMVMQTYFSQLDANQLERLGLAVGQIQEIIGTIDVG